MVEDANKLGGALGQAAREGDGWENVTGNMTQAWTDFKAIIGQPFLEVATDALLWLTDVMGKMDAQSMADGISNAFGFIRDTFNDFMNSPGMIFLRETLPEAFRIIRKVITDALSSDGVGAVFEGLGTYFERVQE